MPVLMLKDEHTRMLFLHLVPEKGADVEQISEIVANDIKKQVHELSTTVYQIRGHIKGKTLLPFPQVRGGQDGVPGGRGAR